MIANITGVALFVLAMVVLYLGPILLTRRALRESDSSSLETAQERTVPRAASHSPLGVGFPELLPELTSDTDALLDPSSASSPPAGLHSIGRESA